MERGTYAVEGIVVQKTTDGIILRNRLSVTQNAVLSREGTLVDDLERVVEYALTSFLRDPHYTIGRLFLLQQEVYEVQAVVLIRGKSLITLVLHILPGEIDIHGGCSRE